MGRWSVRWALGLPPTPRALVLAGCAYAAPAALAFAYLAALGRPDRAAAALLGAEAAFGFALVGLLLAVAGASLARAPGELRPAAIALAVTNGFIGLWTLGAAFGPEVARERVPVVAFLGASQLLAAAVCGVLLAAARRRVPTR